MARNILKQLKSLKQKVNYVLSRNREYKIYTALISQTGTEDPSIDVLENTIGDIVWTRDDIGNYLGTLEGAFPPAGTFFQYSYAFPIGSETGIAIMGNREDNNTLTILSMQNGSPADSVIGLGGFGSALEIRIYPVL